MARETPNIPVVPGIESANREPAAAANAAAASAEGSGVDRPAPMPGPKQVPQYRLLADSFFAPKMLPAGSIVATHAPPGNHMQPLNAAAEERMEEWYNEEFDELDKDGKKTGQKVRPHLKHRIQRFEPGISHRVEVLAEPRPDDMTNSLSLAEAHQPGFRDTDQRPGPLRIPDVASPAPVPEAEAVKEQSGAEVVEEAPRTGPGSTVKVS